MQDLNNPRPLSNLSCDIPAKSHDILLTQTYQKAKVISMDRFSPYHITCLIGCFNKDMLQHIFYDHIKTLETNIRALVKIVS